jgi:hypothetical protein
MFNIIVIDASTSHIRLLYEFDDVLSRTIMEAPVGVKSPTLYDYLAGAILANGAILIGRVIMGSIAGYFPSVPTSIFSDVSYMMFVAVATAVSYLVCKRTSSKHLAVGLRLAALEWMFSIVFTLSVVGQLSLNLVITFFVCFLLGAVIGAYMALRSKLRSARLSTKGVHDA